MTQSGDHNDTRIGEQPALRASHGRSWLVMGALMTVASGGLLLALSTRQPMLGFIGAGIVGGVYVLMVITTIAIRNLRVRLVTLAVLLAAMAAVAIGFVLAITAAEWSVNF